MFYANRENETYYKALITGETDVSNIFTLGKVDDTSEDLMLAQMLQYEYDREYDQQLNREEKHYNGNSKGMCFLFIFLFGGGKCVYLKLLVKLFF